MNTTNKRIGCLGLSADPPHVGHMQVARLLLEDNWVDEVWLIPCFEHSFGKPLSEARHRLAMLRLLEEKGIKAVDIEFFRKGKSYTIDTVRALKRQYSDCQFFWVIGSDIIKTQSYKRWKDWKTLFSLITFLVVLRPGFEVEKLPAGFVLAEKEIVKVSSSEIREKVRHGLSIEGLVLPTVKEYIKKHGLYQN